MKNRLIELKRGDVFKIVDFDESCGNFRQRLIDLGIHKGQMGQILNKSLFGPIEIDLEGRKIAIGRGMAKKIYVKKFECPIL
ncbi:ferrous iron transport protein A [Caminibacter sp.]